jgi:hypothetical protein
MGYPSADLALRMPANRSARVTGLSRMTNPPALKALTACGSGLRVRRIPPQHLLARAAEGGQALDELIGHQTQAAGGPGGGAVDE